MQRFENSSHACHGSKYPLHSHCNDRAGDASTLAVGWQDAQEAASEWLGTLRLGRDLTGKSVDLSDKGDTLSVTGDFRRMVLEAARRKLVKRGAKEIILPL